MNKKQILSMFLKDGVLVPPDMLEKTNEENYKEILESLKEKREPEKRAKTTTEAVEGKKEATVKDFLDYYNRKYEFLKGVLLKKLDAVSINKGKKIFSKTSIIGRIKEKTGRGFVMEDVTGETEVITDNTNVSPGDVMGLKGRFREGGFFPEEVVWPDIPLTSKGGLPDILLTGKLTQGIKEGRGKDTIIIELDPDKKGTPNPNRISIFQGERKISILAFKPKKTIGDQDAVKFLKKRELPHKEEAGIYTAFLIEKIPDVVWLVENKENWTKNYKGILVVSTGRGSLFEYKEGSGGKFGNI